MFQARSPATLLRAELSDLLRNGASEANKARPELFYDSWLVSDKVSDDDFASDVEISLAAGIEFLGRFLRLGSYVEFAKPELEPGCVIYEDGPVSVRVRVTYESESSETAGWRICLESLISSDVEIPESGVIPLA